MTTTIDPPAETTDDHSGYYAPGGRYEQELREQVSLDREIKILEAVERKLVTREADRLYAELLEAENPQPPMEAGFASDLLATLGAEAPARVECLIPAEGRLLLAAQRKTGKTTFIVNLTRSLITGEPFLGKLAVRAVTGRVAILNYEVSGRTLLQWLTDTGVPLDRVFLVNLRGKRNPLLTEKGRDELVALLRAADAEVLLVDPFGRAYGGKSQNDASEVTPWLVKLDEVATDAGCSELVLTTHAGWEANRTRGSSALEDWPDTVAWMTRNDNDRRFLKAEGRMDDSISEQGLNWDTDTRILTLAGGGGRKQEAQSVKINALTGPCIQAVRDNPGANVAKVEDVLRAQGVQFRTGEVGKALAECVSSTLMTQAQGARRSKLFTLITEPLWDPILEEARNESSQASGEDSNG